ncbi:MAG: hypothetical protein KDK71_09995, partial [Chlamydiia bacterium]|nr:hypothetical protein [Chlamydiia bacterium]
MTWGLFTQNCELEPVLAGLPMPSYPSEGGQEITAETLYVGSVTPGTNMEGPRSLFACGTNGKIMLNHKNWGSVMVSIDDGDTWTERTLPSTQNANWYFTGMAYDQEGDIWYVAIHDSATSPANKTHFYWSDDDGANWSELDASTYRSKCVGIAVDDSGALWAAGKPAYTTSAVRVWKYADPTNSDTFSYVSGPSASEQSYGAAFCGSEFMVPHDTSRLATISAALSFTDLGSGIVPSYGRYFDGSPDRMLYYSSTDGSGLMTLLNYTPGDTAPLDTTNVDLGAAHGHVTVSYGDGIFLAAATDNAATDSLLVAHSASSALDWIGAHTVAMGASRRSGESWPQRQVDYCGDGRWLVCYEQTTGAYRRLERFQLGT